MRNFLKRIMIRLKNPTVRIGKRAKVSASARFGGYNKIGKRSMFSGQLGRCSYLGEDCRINANIGKFCSIGNGVVTAGGSHPTRTWASTHPAFYSAAKQCGTSFVSQEHFQETALPAVIGNDVWIGTGALLIGGVTIGDGAVIGAGAVVTKDVAPYTIVAGNPAGELRKRFSDEDIAFLLAHGWWDQPEDWLKAHADCFQDIALLKEAFDKEKP